MKRISIIIPVLNEAARIPGLLRELSARSTTGQVCEVLVVDGGSSDQGPEIAASLGARVLKAPQGRASQMNHGALAATGEILYFLHADSIPPLGYDQEILRANSEKDQAGCFRLRFDPPHWFLSFFAWCTRINHPLCRGGDQSLFIPRHWFEALGGYDEAFRVYEDNEFIGRVYRTYGFRVLPARVTTSSRRYEKNGALRLQYHFTVIHLKRLLGTGPEDLHHYYEKHIRGRA